MLAAVAVLCGVGLVVGGDLVEAPGPDVAPEPASPIGRAVTPGDTTSERDDGTWVTVHEWMQRCREYYEVRTASRSIECVPVEGGDGLPGE
ncbi:hypothetical protein [Agromyces sp. SYSU T00194]|uniref:hypothetical protein n=1 Tax=Agromyces chitinivorans TaxID=3158560 RepID=UPI003397D182